MKKEQLINEIANIVRLHPDDTLDGVNVCDITDALGNTIVTDGVELSLVEYSQLNDSITVTGTKLENGSLTKRKLNSLKTKVLNSVWEGLRRKQPGYIQNKIMSLTCELTDVVKKEIDKLVGNVLFHSELDWNNAIQNVDVMPKAIVAAVLEKVMYDLIEHRAEIFDEKNNVLEMLAK